MAIQCGFLPSELGVFQDPVNSIQVELDKSIVNRSLVPIFRDSLPSFTIGQIAFFAVDAVEVADMAFGWAKVSTPIVHKPFPVQFIVSLTQDTLGILARMVSEHSSREDITRISGNEAGDRPIVEVGVGLDALVKTDRCTLGHEIHVEGVVACHVVPRHELVHVQLVVVSGDVEVVTSVGGIRFDEVVGAIKTERCAYDNLVSRCKGRTNLIRGILTQNPSKVIK